MIDQNYIGVMAIYLYLHISVCYIHNRMPQCICYFPKKITETFSYPWKNCIINAQTWTRPGAATDYYGSSKGRSSDSSFPQCWNNLCWTRLQEVHWSCFNIGGMIRSMLLSSTWTTPTFWDGHISATTGVKTALNQIMLSLKTQV